MSYEGDMSQQIGRTPFDTAPALYAFNVPRYYTLMQRAKDFANVHQHRIQWCFATDLPLNADDRDLTPEQLDDKRWQWLAYHDQQTGHIASTVPLVPGMPVRLTDSVDRDRMLYRGRRGVIVGWAPHPAEEKVAMDGAWALTKMPQAIYVRFENSRWTIHDELGEGVYPITPVSRTWTVNRRTGVRARRTGYFLVPDFASTAHMIQGQSLLAAFVDLVSNDGTEDSTEEQYLKAYVMLSRAKVLDNLWILRPFAKDLFHQGPPTGPNIFMKKLKNELSWDQDGCTPKDLQRYQCTGLRYDKTFGGKPFGGKEMHRYTQRNAQLLSDVPSKATRLASKSQRQ